MSITFWCPDAPTTRVQPYPEFDPEFWDEVSTLPSCNFSYLNGPRLLRQLGLPEECGELAPEALPDVIARLAPMRAEVVERARQEYCTGGGEQCLSELRRMDNLHAVLEAGVAHQQRVAWG